MDKALMNKVLLNKALTNKKANLIRSSISLFSGILFGAGMIISGMSDPEKVLGFLDITGAWDPSLAFVMGGALLVFVPFHYFVIKPRKHAINGEAYSTPKSAVIDKSLISGAAIFGAGWGLAGICPGPAISSLGSGSLTIIVFTLSMLVGMSLARYMTNARNRKDSGVCQVDC